MHSNYIYTVVLTFVRIFTKMTKLCFFTIVIPTTATTFKIINKNF